MTNKRYAILGLLSPAMLWTTYFIMATKRPEYSFKYKAISELGSLDAPDLWVWNILGYIIPGILISIFAIGLHKSVLHGKASKLPFYGLFLSGLFMTLSGIFPADMDNRGSLTTILHMIGSYGSYISFLIAAFSYPKQWKKDNYWSGAIRPTLIFTWLTILFGSWYMIFPEMPSVGQRLVFLFYFLWIIFTAFKLYKLPEEKKNHPANSGFASGFRNASV